MDMETVYQRYGSMEVPQVKQRIDCTFVQLLVVKQITVLILLIQWFEGSGVLWKSANDWKDHLIDIL